MSFLDSLNRLFHRVGAGRGSGRRQKLASAAAHEKEEVTATQMVAQGLGTQKIRELFEVLQLRDVVPQLPRDFAGGPVLQLLFMGSPLIGEFRSKGAGAILTAYIGRAELMPTREEKEYAFRSAADRLPLRDLSCRWALGSAPQAPAVPLAGMICEMGRVVEPGGGGVIVDWHPYSVAVVRALASRPTTDEKEGIGFEKYFRAFKKAGFQVSAVRESFVDGSVRKLMEQPEEKAWYEKYRKTPLALSFFLKKQR